MGCIQREAHGGDVIFVAVSKIGPEQLLGDLRDVLAVGRKECRKPNLSFQSFGTECLPRLVGQLKGLDFLGFRRERFREAVSGVIGEGVEVVRSVYTQNQQTNQRQGQHDSQENRILFDGDEKRRFHAIKTILANRSSPEKSWFRQNQWKALNSPKCPKPSVMAIKIK